MGRRRFALSRKKYYSKSQPVDLTSLRKEVKEADLGGWAYVPKDVGIRICKFVEGDMPTAILSLEVHEKKATWSTSFRGKDITVPASKENLPCQVKTIDDLLTIIEAVDDCNFCTGVNNPKYAPIIASHDGVFRNHQGIAI